MDILPIIPVNADDLEEHFQILKIMYSIRNESPMDELEEKFYKTRMSTAIAVNKAFTCGTSFIYLTIQEPDGWHIIAAYLDEDPTTDAAFVASICITDQVLSMRPVGEYFCHLLPFLNRGSIKRFRAGLIDRIKIINPENFEKFLDYLELDDE